MEALIKNITKMDGSQTRRKAYTTKRLIDIEFDPDRVLRAAVMRYADNPAPQGMRIDGTLERYAAVSDAMPFKSVQETAD